MMRRILLMAAAAVFVINCGEVVTEPTVAEPELWGEELPIGSLDDPDDLKADRGWGAAVVCKAVPYYPTLNDPMIVISLDGLSLHLFDRAGSYDEVFSIGVGAIEDGESLTPVSTNRPDQLFYTRTDLPSVIDGPTPTEARWGWNHECRMWWTDEDGSKVPVFAGLPFIRLQGPRTSGYGIHGPIDRFRQEDGGDLRRGYVSHGCIRMEAAAVLEVFARIQGSRTPVRIQQAIERRSDDRSVDVEPWIMSECRTDGDCGEGLFCHSNEYSGRSFCTQRCTQYCPDRYGSAGTFCVDDPNNPEQGICVLQSTEFNNNCERFDHFVPVAGVPRFNQPSVRRDVCMPGTEGWIGDRCLGGHDCLSGQCEVTTEGAGVCTEACTRYCPDLDGHAGTFCVTDTEGAGACAARCVSNDDCAMGSTCENTPRFGQPTVERLACLPY